MEYVFQFFAAVFGIFMVFTAGFYFLTYLFCKLLANAMTPKPSIRYTPSSKEPNWVSQEEANRRMDNNNIKSDTSSVKEDEDVVDAPTPAKRAGSKSSSTKKTQTKSKNSSKKSESKKEEPKKEGPKKEEPKKKESSKTEDFYDAFDDEEYEDEFENELAAFFA